ncbi:Imm27 family immunity protein [Pontibacter pudoricolor]|uniref:Imm27 family immunity protein n=1 Tax=Pontibacter pudoricolor TaxID=2694930 RepID=UPI001390A9B5|nr:Imm27 family immunity protein [Pontibacter pudoricolor]
MREIDQYENQLIGSWEFKDGQIREDYISQRINWLISNYLIRLCSDTSGWYILYKDPNDGRFWELSYPESSSHGGGAPSLINLSYAEVKKKYALE